MLEKEFVEDKQYFINDIVCELRQRKNNLDKNLKVDLSDIERVAMYKSAQNIADNGLQGNLLERYKLYQEDKQKIYENILLKYKEEFDFINELTEFLKGLEEKYKEEK